MIDMYLSLTSTQLSGVHRNTVHTIDSKYPLSVLIDLGLLYEYEKEHATLSVINIYYVFLNICMINTILYNIAQ